MSYHKPKAQVTGWRNQCNSITIDVHREFDSFGNKTIMVKETATLESLHKRCLAANGPHVKIPNGCFIEVVVKGKCLSDWIDAGYKIVSDLHLNGNEEAHINVYNEDEQMIVKTSHNWSVYTTSTGKSQYRPNM